MPPLVLLVVECGKGQDVEEEERGSHGNGYAQLRGVVPLVLDHDSRVIADVAALALVRGLLRVGGRNPRVACGRRPRFAQSFSVREGRGILRRDLGGRRNVLEQIVYVVQVRDKLQPEGNLGGTVMVTDSGFQANVKVELIFGVVLGPGHLLEAVGLGVDELGVLWYRLIRISVGKKRENMYMSFCTLALAMGEHVRVQTVSDT